MVRCLSFVFTFGFLFHCAILTDEKRQSGKDVRQILWKVVGNKCKSSNERYDSKTKRCQLLGSVSPVCPKDERFFPLDDQYGYCDCDSFHEAHIVYYPNTKSCYRLLSQGPCNASEWLEWDSDAKKAICLPAKCQNDGRHVLWTNGQCYQLDTQGPCQPYHILMRWKSPNNIICQVPVFLIWNNIPVVKNCRQGSKMRYLKKCFSLD